MRATDRWLAVAWLPCCTAGRQRGGGCAQRVQLEGEARLSTACFFGGAGERLTVWTGCNCRCEQCPMFARHTPLGQPACRAASLLGLVGRAWWTPMSTLKHAYPAFTFPICRQALMILHLPSSSQGLVDPQEHKKRGGRRGRGSALGDDEGSDGEVRCMRATVAVRLADCVQHGEGSKAGQGRAGHVVGAVFAWCCFACDRLEPPQRLVVSAATTRPAPALLSGRTPPCRCPCRRASWALHPTAARTCSARRT